MGWDRIRYFEGADGESTLISADKSSAEVVYGYQFSAFARHLGYKVRRIVDLDRLPGDEQLQALVNKDDAQVAKFPGTARVRQGEHPIAQDAIELRPPVSTDGIRTLNAFFMSVCEPSDEGMIIDHFDPTDVRIIAQF